MKKTLSVVLAIVTVVLGMQAQSFSTAGDGTIYSFDELSKIAGSGVSKVDGTYIVEGVVNISYGDEFVIDNCVTVLFGDDSELVIKGKANLCSSSPTVLGRLGESTTCRGIDIQSEEVTNVSNLTFDYVGLHGGTAVGINVNDCTFTHHNGSTSSALFLGDDGASFTITNCTFEDCQKAAIGGAANYICPVVISNCVFKHNSRSNNNIPQINLTASTAITIKDCVVEGDSTLNMVGGIAIANWFGIEGMSTIIERCVITNNRYGITTLGVMDVAIRDNMISNNKYETNPNNGGSGISLYDPNYKQTAMISGNTIEKSLWGITIIGCDNVNLGKTEVAIDAPDYNPGNNVFFDNGNNGFLYDVYNNSSNTVYAQGNRWNVVTQDSVSVERVVYHKNDNPSLGEVIFIPTGEMLNIHTVEHSGNRHTHIYDLHGIPIDTRILQGCRRGIYILNGKKIMR